MTILVLGGTGRTGRLIADLAVQRGLSVVLFGRTAGAALSRPGIAPVAGDATSEDDLRRAIAACSGEVVTVSALSIPRASKSPFARVTGPPDLHSRSARALLSALSGASARRLIKISAQGVGDSAPRAGLAFRLLVAVSNLGPAFRDHALADSIIKGSDLDWTILHPPALSEGRSAGAPRAGEDVTTGGFERLPREDLARFVLDIASDPTYHRRALSLGCGSG